jgi:hypothetical protein
LLHGSTAITSGQGMAVRAWHLLFDFLEMRRVMARRFSTPKRRLAVLNMLRKGAW